MESHFKLIRANTIIQATQQRLFFVKMTKIPLLNLLLRDSLK